MPGKNGSKKILVAYFSKTGHTGQLARAIGRELELRGHKVTYEEIKRSKDVSWLREVLRDAKSYPNAFTRVLFSRTYREQFLKNYSQVEEDIRPLEFGDVGQFDRVCIGGPKWVYISYPVARYLSTIRGLEGKGVGTFSTFCGPPIQSFEIDLIDIPMRYAVERKGGKVIATAGLTTAFHEAGLRPVFKLLSLLLFHKPVEEFMLGSAFADKQIKNFCDDLERN